MKYFCNITFLVLLMGTIVSCAPETKDKEFKDLRKTEYTYEARNEDSELFRNKSLNFDIEAVIGLDSAKNNQTPWLNNSIEIFKLAENSLSLGDSFSGNMRAEYKKFGHKLMSLFYQSSQNSTQFNNSQSLYLPAALGFEGEKIKSTFKDMVRPGNIEGIKASFQNHSIKWSEERPTLKPAEFIISIRDYLEKIPSLFLKNGVSDLFVKTFSNQLDREYIQALNKAEIALEDINQYQKLKINAEVISEVIETLDFIPEKAVSALSGSLVKAKNYAELIEPTHASGRPQLERLVQVIASIWLDLNPAQRLKYIKPANEMLYAKLNDTSEKMLLWLAGREDLDLIDKEYYLSGFFRAGFMDRLGTSCHRDIRSDLTAWIGYSNEQKAQFRAANRQLFNIFSRYTTEEIRTDILSYYEEGEFQQPFTGGSTVEKFRSEILPICVSRVQALLDRSINLYLLTELDIEIRTWGKMIEQVVADTTFENLNAISDAIKSPEKFESYFNKMAYPILNDVIFNNETLDGIENSRVQLFVSQKNQFNTRNKQVGSFVTGGEVIGVSLAASYRRFLGMPEFEGKAVNSRDYYQTVFSQLNKMISMIGFRTIDNDLFPSLNRNFVGDIEEFDVYKYECSPERVAAQQEMKQKYTSEPTADNYVTIREDCRGYEDYHKNIFQIPDRLEINGAFMPGNFVEYSSIRAQAEVIRGAALMLNYFNDWRGPTDFDAGMAKLKFGDMDLFPKSAFVNLVVAAMTTPLRGLQRPGSSLKLFNMFGEEVSDLMENGLPDPAQASSTMDPSKQIVEAAVVDLLQSGPSRVVKALDMAYFMVAIDEFLKATEGIELTKASVLNPANKVEKHNMEAILKGRKLLKLMMFAMSNFLVNHMQDTNGGFWSEYNLDEEKENEPKTLEVQIAVIDALLRSYNIWGGEAVLARAVEAYYFMNQNLWDHEISFYRSSEDSSHRTIRPDLYLSVIMNYKKIQPYLNSNSAAQAETMFDYHAKKLLNLFKSLK